MRDKQKNNENNTQIYLFFHLKFVKKTTTIVIEIDHRFLTYSDTHFPPFWEPLGTHLGVLGDHLGGLERSVGSLVPSLGASLGHLGPSWVPLGYTLANFGPSRVILDPPKPHFGASGDQFWSPVGCLLGCLLALFLPPDTCTVGGQISGGTCEALGWA